MEKKIKKTTIFCSVFENIFNETVFKYTIRISE